MRSALIMVLVVTFVSFWIHLYSAEFMDRGRGLQPLLRVHEPIRGLDADPGVGRQHAAALYGMGRRWSLQLSAHRFLVQGPGERSGGPQGIYCDTRRRYGDDDRAVPALQPTRYAANPGPDAPRKRPMAGRLGAGHGCRGAFARRSSRQISPTPAADLAARRDGRPDSRSAP